MLCMFSMPLILNSNTTKKYLPFFLGHHKTIQNFEAQTPIHHVRPVVEVRLWRGWHHTRVVHDGQLLQFAEGGQVCHLRPKVNICKSAHQISVCVWGNERGMRTSLRSVISLDANDRMDTLAGRLAGTVRRVVTLFPCRSSVCKIGGKKIYAKPSIIQTLFVKLH